LGGTGEKPLWTGRGNLVGGGKGKSGGVCVGGGGGGMCECMFLCAYVDMYLTSAVMFANMYV